MARYIDSGTGDPNHAIGKWLDDNLVAGIQEFRGQFGYFAFGAFRQYAPILSDAALAGCPVHLVLGSNEGTLTAADLTSVLPIVEGIASASLTVVAFANALFHPKTVHIVRADGSATALVGSGNFTESGLGINVEAAIILDADGGDELHLLQEIANAAERWHTLTQDSVFPVRTQADIDALIRDGIINIPPPVRVPRLSVITATTRQARRLGTRKRLWRPKRRSARSSDAEPVIAEVQPSSLPAGGTVTPLRWCKQLKSSDAQQVRAGSNPTGKLRLTQSHHAIDHRTFFRTELFSLLSWASQVKNGNQIEVATADFIVTVREQNLGRISLVLDHASHREAGQNNVVTVLAWGRQLGQILAATSYVDDWVIIERDASGSLMLTIQSAKPAWAP